MEVPPVLKYGWQISNSALGREKYEKDTNKKGLPQCWCFSNTILILFNWQICIILFVKSIFFLNLTCIGTHIPLLQGYSLWKIIDNHSSFNMDFMWLVMWSGFKRFWRKRYRGSKKRLWGFFIFLKQESSTKCYEKQFMFLPRSYSSFLSFSLFFFCDNIICSNWWHTFSFWISFLWFWLESFWCTPSWIDLFQEAFDMYFKLNSNMLVILV